MTAETFEALGLAEPLARSVRECGYTLPTPIQQTAIRPQLEGRDLLALAETGSGKTAAFLIPLLARLGERTGEPAPRSALTLVLAPTRELALQIDAEAAKLSRHQGLRRAVVLGGVGKGGQIQALKRGVHILVATPGRLLDLISERHVSLADVGTLVLDEADRMFDMGFIRDIRKIVSMMPKHRRTALFSATMPGEIRKLATEILTDPARIDLSPKQIVVDRIDQRVMFVPASHKQGRLHTLLNDDAYSRVIVFTRTKRGADRVADRLAMAGIGAAAIHGNKAQNARQRALKDFSAGHVRVLVATDIAARGIDVSDITHVVNFDMPVEPETYVHRIGRTARKGTSGIAISLCDPSEKPEMAAIERLTKQKIEVIADVGGESPPPAQNRGHHARQDGDDRQGADRSEPRRHARNGRRNEAEAGSGRRDGRPRHSHARRDERVPRSMNGDTASHAVAGERSSQARHGDAVHAGDRDHRAGQRKNAGHGGDHRSTQHRKAERDLATARRPDRDGARAHQNAHRGDHRNSEHRSGEHRGGEKRSGEHRSGEHRGGEKRTGGRSQDRNPAAPGTRETNGSRHWNGQRPPKFLAASSERGRRAPASRS